MRGNLVRLVVVALAAAAGILGVLTPATAQPREVVIGVLYPLSGPTAQAGVDARVAAELAAEVVNGKHDLDLPLARTEGLPGLGGAKLRLVVVDHQGKPELGQTEAERRPERAGDAPHHSVARRRSPGGLAVRAGDGGRALPAAQVERPEVTRRRTC